MGWIATEQLDEGKTPQGTSLKMNHLDFFVKLK